jgi:hexosaminidase
MDIISHHLEWVGSTHLKNKQMMLRRMAGTDDVSSLELVVDLVEPVKGYQRNNADNFTKYAPYTLMVDIALADPPKLRVFRKLIEDYLNVRDTIQYHKLKSLFTNWQINHQDVKRLAQTKPLLEPILFHSESLSILGQIGLKYLESKTSKRTSNDDLLKNFNTIKLSRSVVNGYCELMVFESIEKLLKN